jgi:hypothetical protein
MSKNQVSEALKGLSPMTGGQGPRILALFGDQPEVLEGIIEARARRCGFGQIAKALSTPEERVSESAVKTFLRSRGID